MSLSLQAHLTIVVERKFVSERIVRGHASALGDVVVVASQRSDDRTLSVTRLVRRDQTVEAKELGKGSVIGAIAVSSTGMRAAYDLDGQLQIWHGDQRQTAPSPTDRLSAAAWVGDDRLALAAGLIWPPIHVRNALGLERSVIEPLLSEAPHHRPCLAASEETGVLAFCWAWSELTVISGVEPMVRQTLLKADSSEMSLALGIWFVEGGQAVVVAPWPDTRAGAPVVLFCGAAHGSTRLEPALRIPCAAAIAPISSSQAVAAPIEKPGAILRFGPGEQRHTLAELPRRIWGVHPRPDGGLVAWTEDTVYWLDPTSHA